MKSAREYATPQGVRNEQTYGTRVPMEAA
jgi:hypothetical protein